MDYRTLPVDRALTATEATEIVGSKVPPREANVTQATVAYDATTNEPVYAYLPVAGMAELRRAVLHLPSWGTTRRGGTGTENKSRTFGYSPRRPTMRREACRETSLGAEAPDVNRTLTAWATRLGDVMRDILPEQAQHDADVTAKVLPEWRLGETEAWTSGVINRTSELPYHRDAFNFPVWSAMPVVRRHVDGGHLHIPEYDATIQCRDGWALFFPGYQLVHGVTPLKLSRPGGYRISVVFYALAGMKDCFTAALETRYGQQQRTARERDIAARLAAGDSTIGGKGK